jgi:GAF domain-containing protein
MNNEPLRVLFVDDERSFREPLVEFIQAELDGIELMTAASYCEALEHVLGRPPGYFQVAIIDDVLISENEGEPPPGTGIDLMREIDYHSPQTEYIIYTGWGTRRGMDALRAGAYYLSKAAAFDELILYIQFAAEKGRLKSTAQEKRLLEQLLKGGAALLSDNSREQVLETILHCVQSIGFDRVRLYWLSEDGRWLEGIAQVGGGRADFVGSCRPVAEDIYLQYLLADPRVHLFHQPATEPVPFDQAADGPDEWACVPLLLDGQVVGKLSVDNLVSRRPIRPETFEPLMLFASQAAAAIVTSRLRGDLQRAAREAGIRADKMEAIQRLLAAIHNTLDIGEIAQTACRAAVELFDVEHSGFMLADPDLVSGVVLAEYPAIGAVGLPLPLQGVPREEELITDRQVLIIEDVAADEGLGEVGQILASLDIQSILITPVVYRKRLYGSFSLDRIGRQGDFPPDLVELCQTLANQLAVALHNAELLQQFEELHKTSLAVTAELDRSRLLDTIIRQATQLLKARKGGIYEYSAERGDLEVVAAFGHANIKGRRVKTGEGMAGRLLRSDEDVMLVSDYRVWPHRAAVYEGEQPFGSVIEVKLSWQGEIKGILYVDDAPGRHYSADDKRLLRLFADQAAVALVHADVVRNLSRRTQLLDTLSDTSREILSEDEPEKLLHQVVRRGAELMNCRYAGLLINHDILGELELTIQHNFPQDVRGSRVAHADPLFGPVALGGQPLLLRDFPAAESQPPFLADLGLNILLAAPLKAAGKVEAVLFVADEQDNLAFNQDDRDVLERFAANAALALQRAQGLSDDQRGFARLKLLHRISNFMQAEQDPAKIYHVFLTGVTAGYGLCFNRAALLLLGEDRQTLAGALAIGHLSREAAQSDWKVDQTSRRDNIESYLERLEHEGLPITPVGERLRQMPPLTLGEPDADLFARVISEDQYLMLTEESLRWLPEPFVEVFDPAAPGVIVGLRARGQVIGLIVADNRFTQIPIGMEDINSLLAFSATAAAAIDNVRLLQQTREALREKEARVQELTAMRDVAQALVGTTEPQKVLQLIVTYACQVLQAQSACLYPYDAVQQRLVHEQSAFSGISKHLQKKLQRVPPQAYGTTATVLKDEWVGVEDITDRERYRFVGENTFDILQRMGARSFQSIVVKVGSVPLGVLYANYDSPRQFSESEIQTARALANQAAAALEAANLRSLAGEVAKITLLGDIDQTLQSIADYTRKATGSDAVVVYAYDRDKDRLSHRPAVSGVRNPDGVAQLPEVKRLSVVRKMLGREEPYIAHNAAQDDNYRNSRFTREEEIRTVVAVPLRFDQSKVGVMFVNYREVHELGDREQADIQLFADQAAVAIYNAQTLEEVKRQKELVGSRTVAAWVNLMSAIWTHRINTRLTTIGVTVRNIKEELATGSGMTVGFKLETIERLVSELLQRPAVPALGQQKLQTTPLNAHLRERFETLWQSEPYRSVQLRLDLELPDEVAIRADPFWLRYAYDIIADNSIEAMQGVSNRVLTMTTRLTGSKAEIVFGDTGCGIPEEIQRQLFRDQIPKDPDSKGWGAGLLLAQLIVETFGGTIGLGSTGPEGTEMVICFPLEV